MRVLSGVLAAFVLSASAATAGPLTLSNATGGWDPLSVNADAATAATVVVNNQGGSAVDEISWGNADPQSQYDFDPIDGSFDPVLGTPFLLGVFTHHNNVIPEATAGFFGVNYDFSVDTNGIPVSISDAFQFSHNETPNAGPCPVGAPPCADIVNVVGTFPNVLVTVGSDLYFFNLLGFSEDGGVTFSNQFISSEGTNNNVELYAIVTARPISEVPEPASLALMGTGLALIGRQIRRRRAARQ